VKRIGFSTGALALGDFKVGLEMLQRKAVTTVEISVLREHELSLLRDTINQLDLTSFKYVSIHAPSFFEPTNESAIVSKLRNLTEGYPIVVHPNAVYNWDLWKPFTNQLLIENMDRRKDIGRTAKDLERIFGYVPEAGLCFDIGHAKQCDTTMTEAYLILKKFDARLKQVHLSEVSTQSVHARLSSSFISSVQEIAEFIPNNVPVILESPVEESQIVTEIERARTSLCSKAL
jgi:hypothetical protein